MPLDLLIAFLGFAFASSVTPGPNNMMLVASGVNFGVRRTLPHVAGINVGFPVMLLLTGFGLGQIFHRYPAIYIVMKVAGILYMLWLAWSEMSSWGVGRDELPTRIVATSDRERTALRSIVPWRR